LTWLAWRQFRINAALATVATVVVIIVLVVTRDHIASVADPDDLTTGYKSLQLLGTVLIGVPAFIGAFWGAPLLAHELEAGTHRLAWTQSVTRGRWLATKLAVTGLAAVIVTGVFSLVFTWWSLPLDKFGNRIGNANFGQRGVAPIAYTLFALVLGTLAGAVLRRTLPAMAATLFGFFVVRYSFQLFVRGNLLKTITTTRPTDVFGQREGMSPSSGGWIVSSHTVDAAGHTVSGSQIDDIVARTCDLTRDSPDSAYVSCANRLGIHDIVTMHPANQFWSLQGWETASFLTLTFVLALVCFWWLGHRTA
jgi:ABC-type transport system involved in multi-copper enzyme maturation permease subunit